MSKSNSGESPGNREAHPREPQSAANHQDEISDEIVSEHHKRVLATGLNILKSEGIFMPNREPVILVHPKEDEVILLTPAYDGDHPFVRILVEHWNDCSFVVGYTPEFKSFAYDTGALTVVRRFNKRPTDVEIGALLAGEWQGLILV